MQPDIQDQAVIDADELMAKTAGFKLSAEREAMVDDLQSRYPNKKATLLPLLWAIQEQEGWISREWMAYAARRCEVPLSHVLGVVTFYTMYHQKPVGKYHVQVCRNISCHIRGATGIIDAVERKLGLQHGGVSACGKWSLEHVECLAGCSWAPVMQINRTLHENLSPDQAVKILDELE
ncbi:MAG: NAD(P)H-dependent oxidoreductase subunit E [Planctomycetes bacterium]|nr:NAD(P)H-dependent oxidoreductase subunit E [Planctomycetota bacterium]